MSYIKDFDVAPEQMHSYQKGRIYGFIDVGWQIKDVVFQTGFPKETVEAIMAELGIAENGKLERYSTRDIEGDYCAFEYEDKDGNVIRENIDINRPWIEPPEGHVQKFELGEPVLFPKPENRLAFIKREEGNLRKLEEAERKQREDALKRGEEERMEEERMKQDSPEEQEKMQE